MAKQTIREAIVILTDRWNNELSKLEREDWNRRAPSNMSGFNFYIKTIIYGS